jgi:hypothetical protein
MRGSSFCCSAARIAVGDLSEIGRRDIRYRQPEIRVIQQIERLAADMKNQVFAQSKLPADGSVLKAC